MLTCEEDVDDKRRSQTFKLICPKNKEVKTMFFFLKSSPKRDLTNIITQRYLVAIQMLGKAMLWVPAPRCDLWAGWQGGGGAGQPEGSDG